MTRAPSPSRTAEQFVVRFPDGMRDRIADEAKTNNRSMNAEIVARLQASFEPLSKHEQRDLQTQTILEVAKMSMVLFEMMRDTKGASLPETALLSVERIHDMLASMTGKKDD